MQIISTIKKGVKKMMAMPSEMMAKKKADAMANELADRRLVQQMQGQSDNGNYTDPLFRARANVAGYDYQAEYARKRSQAKANQ